jgi:hypothetical protein
MPPKQQQQAVADFQSLLFHTEVDLGVTIGGFQTHVSQPSANHVEFDARFEQVDSRRVSKGVR